MVSGRMRSVAPEHNNADDSEGGSPSTGGRVIPSARARRQGLGCPLMRCAPASATQHAPMSVDGRLVGQRRQITAFVLVLNPDHLSLLETLKAHETMTIFSIPVAGLVVNRVLPDEDDSSSISAKRRLPRTTNICCFCYPMVSGI